MVNIEADSHKLMYHPERVSEWGEKDDCFPIYLEIGPTNICNHRCIFCALDFLEKKGNFIDREVMLSALKDMAEHGVKSVMFAGEGEPLLHKDICEFIEKAKEYGIDVSLTTNGVLFTKEKIEKIIPNLTWIRFSVDAGSPESYGKIHGTKPEDFDKVIDNIKEAVKFKKDNLLKTTIGVQFLMIPQAINEAIKLAEILKNIGADNLQVKPYSHHPKSKNDFSVNSEEYNNLKEELIKFNSDNFRVFFREATAKRIETGIDYPECYGLSFFALIDSEGNIIPCNLFYNEPEFTYGSLYEQKFSEIWKGEKRKKVLQRIRKKGVSECRKGCRLDVVNRYLHRLKNPHPHENFI